MFSYLTPYRIPVFITILSVYIIVGGALCLSGVIGRGVFWRFLKRLAIVLTAAAAFIAVGVFYKNQNAPWTQPGTVWSTASGDVEISVSAEQVWRGRYETTVRVDGRYAYVATDTRGYLHLSAVDGGLIVGDSEYGWFMIGRKTMVLVPEGTIGMFVLRRE